MIYKKLNLKEAITRKKELQQICKECLMNEGFYSLSDWNDFCKYCEIYVSINDNKIIGVLVTSIASIYQCDDMEECLEKNSLKANETIHIMMFVVHPTYRKQGIGKKLFDMIYTQSDYKCNKYILAMRKNNIDAKNFYFKQGFIDTNYKCNVQYENPIDNKIMLIK